MYKSLPKENRDKVQVNIETFFLSFNGLNWKKILLQGEIFI